MSEETVEVTLKFREDIAEKLYYGGGCKTLETTIRMRLADCLYLCEKIRQWEKQGTEPTHQSVLEEQEPPYLFPSAHEEGSNTNGGSGDE